MLDYDKLESLIKSSGKTKSHLCRAMGKPVYYLRDVLSQKTAIPDELQTILAAELGVSVAYLNGLEPKEKPHAESEGLSETKIEFIEAVKQMSDDRILQLMYVLGLKEKDLTE